MVGHTRKFQDSRQTHVFKIGSWAFIFKTCCNFEPANTYPNWEQPLFKYCKQQGTGHVFNKQHPRYEYLSLHSTCIFLALKSHVCMVFQKFQLKWLICNVLAAFYVNNPHIGCFAARARQYGQHESTWYIWHAQKHRASISRGPTTLRKQRFTQEISRACSAVWRHYSAG